MFLSRTARSSRRPTDRFRNKMKRAKRGIGEVECFVSFFLGHPVHVTLHLESGETALGEMVLHRHAAGE
jgi:hypothetical protein